MVDGNIQEIDHSKLNRQEFLKDKNGEFVLDDNGNKVLLPYPPGEYVFKLNGAVAGKSEELGMQNEFARGQRHHECKRQCGLEFGGWQQSHSR